MQNEMRRESGTDPFSSNGRLALSASNNVGNLGFRCGCRGFFGIAADVSYAASTRRLQQPNEISIR